MYKSIIVNIILVFFFNLSVNAQSIEQLRSEGYLARMEGDYEEAIRKYSQIFNTVDWDYDAALALARLYYLKSDYDTALAFYQKIYERDESDVEALTGFGNCYLQTGDLSKSINAFSRAVYILPGHVPLYLLLAKAYSYNGEMDNAIRTYEQANQIDDTYSQVWAGLGRMYYWKSRPATALLYYEKALELDPENRKIEEEYKLVRNEMKFVIKGLFQSFNEKEQAYNINALIHKYMVSKRVGDHLKIDANALFDYSKRDFDGDASDTTRWFNNAWLKANWISENHTFSTYIGASKSDNRLTTYGLGWHVRKKWKPVEISNTLAAGYQYFFYWNEVGKKAVEDNLKIKYKRWEGEFGFSAGLIDDKRTRKFSDESYEIRENPFKAYNLSLKYIFLTNPEIKVGIQHSFMDFDYQSPDYYSPYDRNLMGISAVILKKQKHWYFYGMFAYNLGTEKYYYPGNPGNNPKYVEGSIDVDNWSGGFEIGYSADIFSVSLGGSRFYNPFYENFIGFIGLSVP